MTHDIPLGINLSLGFDSVYTISIFNLSIFFSCVAMGNLTLPAALLFTLMVTMPYCTASWKSAMGMAARQNSVNPYPDEDEFFREFVNEGEFFNNEVLNNVEFNFNYEEGFTSEANSSNEPVPKSKSKEKSKSKSKSKGM